MKIRNIFRNIFICFFIAVSFLVVSTSCSSTKQEIAIAVTSDLHGVLFPWNYLTDTENTQIGFSLVATVINQLKKENPNILLIDAGDVCQGNEAGIFNDMDVHPMIQALNFMKYDLWILGNHDFNFGLDFLNRNIKGFKGDVVSANIKCKDTGKNFVLPYKILVIDGIRVAVVGLTSSFVPYWESKAPEHVKNLYFEVPIDCAKETVKSLEGQYDILVGAFHIGRDSELELAGISGVVQIAEAIPEFDVIFSWHDHSSFCEKINDTIIFGAGTQGNQVSFAKIFLEKQSEKWTVYNIEAKNILTKDFEPNKEIQEAFDFVHKKSRERANEVLGYITEDFNKQGADFITGKDVVTTMPRIQLEDSALMDFASEVALYYSKADIAESNLFNTNLNLKKGALKAKDIHNIFPFENNLLGVKISGKNLLEYMEWNAGYYQTAEEGDVTIAFNPNIRQYAYSMFNGIDYEIDVNKPVGQRIKNATFKGKPINPNSIYKLAITSYRFSLLRDNNWVTEEDIYFNSLIDSPTYPYDRDLVVRYVEEVLKGIITPKCNHNWKLIGLPTTFNDEATICKLKADGISIPSTIDGRTPNIKKIVVGD